MRRAEIERNTNETRIQMTLNLDGSGQYQNDTGCGFLNHMLDLFARHGRFDLAVRCQGDMQVDAHHTEMWASCWVWSLNRRWAICAALRATEA